MSLEPGQIIDSKYRIAKLIGEGGMGAVFEGENTLIHRRVAIKVLHASATGNETVLKRFEREAQAAGRIGSDHILEVLDLGSLQNGDRYMVMEYLEGETLAERIERLGRMTPEQLSPIIRQALIGLKAAHSAGIIHRDLKPENIFILREKAGRTDFVKIIDFGISKFNVLGGDMGMTRTGAVMGTPYYMSPEQAKGSLDIDHRSDLYAIGVIMYEALTGAVPYNGNTFNELMFKIVLSDPPPLEQAVPGLDGGYAAIVKRAMARESAHRFDNAEELIKALDAWAHGAGATLYLPPDASGAISAVTSGSHPAIASAPVQSAAIGVSGHAVGAHGPSGEYGPPAAATNANWAASHSGASTPSPAPRRALVPVLAAAGIGGLLIVFGVAFGAYKLWGSTAASAGAAESVEVEAASSTAPPAKPIDSVTVPSEPVAEKPEEKPVEPKPESSATAAASATASAAPEPTAVKTAQSKPKARAPRAPRPRPRPKPKPATNPRDFGY